MSDRYQFTEEQTQILRAIHRKRARRHAWYTAFAIILALCVIVGVCLMVGVG